MFIKIGRYLSLQYWSLRSSYENLGFSVDRWRLIDLFISQEPWTTTATSWEYGASAPCPWGMAACWCTGRRAGPATSPRRGATPAWGAGPPYITRAPPLRACPTWRATPAARPWGGAPCSGTRPSMISPSPAWAAGPGIRLCTTLAQTRPLPYTCRPRGPSPACSPWGARGAGL